MLLCITNYTPVVPSKTTPDSRPKWTKNIVSFRPKQHKNPTQWWGHIHIQLIKAISPPPPPRALTLYHLGAWKGRASRVKSKNLRDDYAICLLYRHTSRLKFDSNLSIFTYSDTVLYILFLSFHLSSVVYFSVVFLMMLF